MAAPVTYQDFFVKGYRLKNGVMEKIDPSKEPVVSVKHFNEGFSPLKNQIVFPIDPIGKPRMTFGDKANYRPIIQRYWAFKSQLSKLAAGVNYAIGDILNIEFHMPMPKGWDREYKSEMDETPHQLRPDIDNCIKGFCDCLAKEDKTIWNITAKKLWSYTGKIIINQ